jgi:malate synthase
MISAPPIENQELSLQITGNVTTEFANFLTPSALAFIADLVRRFATRRDELLARRFERQQQIDSGLLPDFLPTTAHIRQSQWQVGSTPADLQDRRVEITGPVDRKMVINALNSGAKVFMADFEDAQSPTWQGLMAGQINLRDAVNQVIDYHTPEGKRYQLNSQIATLLVRPRGWHLLEKHILWEGKPIPGALMDFGLYFFHNAHSLIAKGSGPYFYLPKLESHLEARLWNDIFNYAQDTLGIARGTIKATVLIETILGAFEMEEILYELRDHCVGLNCGRWDYIFSFIKRFHKYPDFILPDREQITMTSHFLRSYSQKVIQVCHRRGAHAIGGMAAQIPIKNDPQANEIALTKVRIDKERETQDGHDGTWVAHPGLVPIALEIFNKYMPQPHQKDRQLATLNITAKDLLTLPTGDITPTGLRHNVSAALQYLEAWLGGNGCVPINNLMEDAATAEIARAQLWQWIHYPKGKLNDGRQVTVDLVKQTIHQELEAIQNQVGEQLFQTGCYQLAAKLLEQITTQDEFAEFLTLVAYEHLP